MKSLIVCGVLMLALQAFAHPYPVPEGEVESDAARIDEEVEDGVVEVPLPEEGAQLGDVVNKMDVNEEIEDKFGEFKDNCFPKPSGGCKCNSEAEDGSEVVQEFDKTDIGECKLPLNEVEDGMVAIPVPEEGGMGEVLGKAFVGAEIKARYGEFKDGCFPKPSGGCNCNTENAEGEETTKTFDTEAECKLPVMEAESDGAGNSNQQDETSARYKRVISRKQAKANYDKVVQELNEKFKGLKEGCYPRPKGCLCVIGKNKEGRDITERRRKESDCKCQEGETGPECPAGGA